MRSSPIATTISSPTIIWTTAPARQELREADAGPAFAQITALWRRFKPQGDNEAQTEADWLRPVLEGSGHRYNVQVSMQTPLGAKMPDYVFYPERQHVRRPNVGC